MDRRLGESAGTVVAPGSIFDRNRLFILTHPARHAPARPGASALPDPPPPRLPLRSVVAGLRLLLRARAPHCMVHFARPVPRGPAPILQVRFYFRRIHNRYCAAIAEILLLDKQREGDRDEGHRHVLRR